METAARAAAWLIKRLDLPEERQDVLSFGLVNLFLYVLDAAGLALAAWLSGVPGLTLAAAFTAMFFRSATGGAHFRSAWRCSLVSYGLSAVLGVVAATVGRMSGVGGSGAFVLVAGVLAAAAIGRYAPVDSPAKPIGAAQRVRLRRISWVLLSLWTILEGGWMAAGYRGAALASALGLLLQSGTLTPGGAKASRWIDRHLDGIVGLSNKEAC